MSVWILLLTLLVILVLIAWPYGMPSDPDDPAYFYSRTWRPEVLGLGLLLGLIACVNAHREGDWTGTLLSIGTMTIIILGLVNSKRAKHFIKKEIRSFERSRFNKSDK